MAPQRRPQALSTQELDYLKLTGSHIRALRRDRKMGLEELADRAGIHRTHLWKIEKGQLNAGAVSYLRLAVQLGLPLAALFPGLEHPGATDDTEIQSAVDR